LWFLSRNSRTVLLDLPMAFAFLNKNMSVTLQKVCRLAYHAE
jgi:hypothetical protein